MNARSIIRGAVGVRKGLRIAGAVKGSTGELGRFMRFSLVGGTGVVVDMGILALLLPACGSPALLACAKAGAFLLAMINNFIWNEVWTFRDRHARKTAGSGCPSDRFVQFSAICIASGLLGTTLLVVLATWAGFHPLGANVVSILFGALVNYQLNNAVTWRA